MSEATRFADTGIDIRSGGLAPWARMFARYPSPRIIAVALAVVTVWRIALGSWSQADLIVAGAFVAAQPFTEWVIHVFLLHFRPRTLAGRRVDPYVARKHRAHHRDPRIVELIFIPLPTLVSSIAVGTVIVALAFRNRLALTALMAAWGLMLVYEWTHFLIHAPYQPRSWLFRGISRGHRLHHYKNEHYWFGITSHLGDRVLRTYPEKAAVETSPTCRTLGVAVD